MNKKQFLVSAALCIVIVILGIAAYYKQSSSWETSLDLKDKEIVKNFDVNKVSKIKIKSSSAFLNVQKKDSIWRINEKSGYPADFQAVSDILNRIAEMKSVRKLDAGKEQLSSFELLEPGKGSNSGTLVELYDKDSVKMFALLLGKQHKSKGQENPYFDSSSPDGRYLMMLDGKNNAVLVADPLDMLQPSIPVWLSKDFIRIDGIASVSMASSKKQNNWKISRKAVSDKFILEGMKKDDTPDENRLYSISELLSKLSFADVLPLSKIADTGLGSPDGVLIVDTFDGLRYILTLASRDGRSFLKIDTSLLNNPISPVSSDKGAEAVKAGQEKEQKLNDKMKKEKIYTEWIYEIPEKTASDLLKSFSDLIMKKAETAAPPVKAAPHGNKKSQGRKP